MMHRFFRRNFRYRFGSIRELTPVTLPIVISQAIDVLMIFCDRLFLSQIGKEQLAATLSGGILTFMITTLVTGTLGQINPLVAQYLGAGRKADCTRTLHQGLLFGAVFAPVIFAVAQYGAPHLFAFFNHGGVLLSSELDYFRILSLTIFTTTLRQVFANFFIGIGRTTMVTWATFSAVALNLPLAYALTFGVWGMPRLEIKGAAWATVFAGFLPIVILALKFFSAELRREFQTGNGFRVQGDILLQLLRYGMPAGMEMFVNVGGFTFFTMVMYSYSADIAAATTIVLNWDMVSFLPLLGVSQGASSLVGKYLGARKKKLAWRSAWSGLTAGWMYAAIITTLYFTATQVLIRIFSSEGQRANFNGVLQAGTVMLRISCLYFFFDATYSVLGGILKGAGDTVWTMLVSNSAMWTTAFIVFQFKGHWGLTAFGAWWILTGMIFFLGTLFFLRFLGKKWLDRLMIAG